MRRLGLPVSDDTILRHLKRHAAGNRPISSRIIGIDDWSWRRSWRYGTMIVDLERREVLDILQDRSVASTAQWLKRHPSVEIVNRDRCGLYAQAAREGAPQARQVADRFHLLQNLRIAIEEQMSLSGRATGRALRPDKDNEPYADTTHRRRARHAHRQSRQVVFDAVHALRKEGLPCSEIARRTGYGRRSIAKWLTFDAPPARRRAALKPTSPLYFEAFLAECWTAGNRCGRHLFHDIQARGYTGSFSNLERLLAKWRRAEKVDQDSAALASVNDHQFARDAVPIRDPETGHLISPVVAAALCVKPRAALTASQARKVDALKRESPDFALMRSLGMRFRGLFRSGDSYVDAPYGKGFLSGGLIGCFHMSGL
ncbi:transposase, partial [Sinorhizobium glycinis]